MYEHLDQADEVEEKKTAAAPKDALAKSFPGLSIPNKNQEEIELDFDFEAMIDNKMEESKNESKKRDSRERDRDSRSRERHRDSRSREGRDSRERDRRKRSRSHDRHRRRHGSRDRDDSRERRRHGSRSSSDSRRHRRRRSDSRERRFEKAEFNLGEIYKGRITKILDFGFFVQIQDSKTRQRKEGLVHVSQIRNSRQRLEKA